MTRTIKDFKTIHPPEKLFWDVEDLKKLLSYGGDITIATSTRNIGKTRAAMDFTMERLNKGENVAWERYTKKQLGKTVKTWLEYAPWMEKSTMEDGEGVILEHTNGSQIIFIPYSLSDNVKGIDIPLTYEIKDEFIPERYTTKTRIDTEFESAMSVRKSLKRNGPMRSIYLANCICWQNPYCMEWEIGPIDMGITRKITDKYSVKIDGEVYSETRCIVWENIAMTPAMIKRNLKSDLVAMNEKDIVDYYHNATNVEYTKIGNCPNPNTPLINYQIMSDGYYMGYRMYNGCAYIVNVKPRLDVPTYVGEPEYIDLDKKHFRYVPLGKDFEALFDAGRCIFDSAKTIMAFQRWIWHLRKRM